MISVKSRSKKLQDCQIDVKGGDSNALTSALEQISKQNKKISVYRIRLTYLKDDKHIPITEATYFDNVDDNLQLYIKDLGPQVGWRLVFFVEYLGPILVHSLLYYLSTIESVREAVHYNKPNYDPSLNKIAFILVVAHYVKRELETIFLHTFTLATMPLFNIFKNSFHYWILNGAIALGYFGFGFIFSTDQLSWVYRALHQVKLSTLISLFILSETWNFYIHLKLRVYGDQQKLKGNTTKRVAINEGIFKILVAPNYTFEVWSWVWFTVIFKFNFFALVFLTVSATQMYFWAMKKNKKYGTKRAFFIPYIF
ncbi:very-long-chain enoyl-CoA reductase [Monosporozyma unispora]